MSRFKKIMAFVAMFGLYVVASTMEYNDAKGGGLKSQDETTGGEAVTMEQAR